MTNKKISPLEALKYVESFIGKNIDNVSVEESIKLGTAIGIINTALKEREKYRKDCLRLMEENFKKGNCYEN